MTKERFGVRHESTTLLQPHGHFREAGITPCVLSKEWKELEAHGLVNRKVCNTRPITVAYCPTPYSASLEDVVLSMYAWNLRHRKRIMKK